MSDNLKQVEQNIDSAIDPNAGIGGIKALNHNTVLKEVLNKAGKFSGMPFIAKADTNAGVVSVGSFIWNGNAMNNTSPFIITLSKLTADLNDVGLLLAKLGGGDLIRFKDYEGRSVFLEFVFFTSDTDVNGNDIYEVTVKGLAENTNYTYNSSDDQLGVIEFFTFSATATPNKVDIDGVLYNFKKQGLIGTPTAPEKYDIAEGGIRSVTDSSGTYNVYTTLIYNTGTPSDINSWQIIYEKELLF